MKRLATALFVLVFLIVVSVIWWFTSLTPLNPQSKEIKTFVIGRGDGVREIAKKLHDQGLIRNQIAFFLLVKQMGLEKSIQAGTYKLSPSLSAADLARQLTLGTEDTWITIPEGWRREEIADYLAKKSFPAAPGAKADFPEGRLFPDTYLVPKQSSISDIEALMVRNFDRKITFPVTGDQLIIASLVEREAKTPADRPLVASVISNRLKAGMGLYIDATVQYAIGYTAKDGWWTKELTDADLKFKSPYNTYLHAGLPPGPICNPGLSAIQAAVSPEKTDYLYYLSDKSGRMHFAKTLDEHNANVAKYL